MRSVAWCAAIVCGALLSSLSASRATPAPPSLHVISCQVVSGAFLPQADEVGLAVRFENDSPSALTSIVWRAKYANGYVDFIDDGTFSPGVRIDNYVLSEQGTSRVNWGGVAATLMAIAFHAPSASSTARITSTTLPPYAGTEQPENCSIVRTNAETGEMWNNSTIPAQLLAITAQPHAFRSVAAPIASAPATPSEPIHLQQCTLQVLNGQPHLEVVYRNTVESVADQVTFRASYGSSGVDFSDQGKFSKGASITHDLRRDLPSGMSPHMYFSLNDPAGCAVVNVHYTDGTKWQNPSVAALADPLPTAVPDAIDLWNTRGIHWSGLRGVPTPSPTPAAAATASPR